ncbi:hypothetical protein DXG03_001814 [Asterophora parasitica]|uniref:Uncharacterized protein n=1 Tax=Asterophora parasitica TaxID=117018 RepID=A0A9P7G4J8_9AGAR|nr:hypothetical protein DXG03_001814 [Asterophora parasitica]
MKRQPDDDEVPWPASGPSVAKKPRGALTETHGTGSAIGLQHALDFTALDSHSSISERFDLVGSTILHDFELVVRVDEVETAFEILELEFYLWKDGCHEDPFTHGNEEQRVSGRWSFHRSPRRSADSHRSATSATGYRGGSRKGLDLTIGGPAPPTSSPYFSQGATTNSSDQPSAIGIRGGALLRSLQRVSDSKQVISGPSLIVDEILRLSSAPSISSLVEQTWSNNISAFACSRNGTSLFLRPKATASSVSTPPTVYRSPRIGLDLSHPGTTASPTHPRVVFLARRYRYFTHPTFLTANGRTQTFLGVLRTCLDLDLDAGQALDDDDDQLRAAVKRIMGLGEPTVARYLGYFRGGRESGKLEAFVGAKGKGASQSPATYLAMMGTLDQYRAETDVRGIVA